MSRSSSGLVLFVTCVCVIGSTYMLSSFLRPCPTNPVPHDTYAVPKPGEKNDSTQQQQQQQQQQLQQAKPEKPKLVFKGDSTLVLTENMTVEEADKNYYGFLFKLHYTCEDYIRPGDVVDGGWDICLVEPYALQKPCLVYSFGINWDFTFDDSVSMKFGCTIRAFDPSMSNVNDHRRGANIWFYKLGLGDSDTVTPNGWKIKTLQSIVNHLNDTGKTIDYLKIDIENNEWKSLEAMYTSDILTRVKQFGIEIHTMPVGLRDTKAFYYRWKILKRLEDDFGFRRWYWHFNHYGAYQAAGSIRSCCYELVYINTNFLPNRS